LAEEQEIFHSIQKKRSISHPLAACEKDLSTR